MPTSQEYQTMYYRARYGMLARHFAVGLRTRVNYLSEFNNLIRTDPAPDAPPSGQGAPHRWSITAHARDNPLMWTARLLSMLAAEYTLGNRKAERIITLALDTVEE